MGSNWEQLGAKVGPIWTNLGQEALGVLGFDTASWTSERRLPPVEEVRAAYRRLIRTSHPDRAGDAGHARTVQLNAARDVLKQAQPW